MGPGAAAAAAAVVDYGDISRISLCIISVEAAVLQRKGSQSQSQEYLHY